MNGKIIDLIDVTIKIPQQIENPESKPILKLVRDSILIFL